MAKRLVDMLASLPSARQERIEQRAQALMSLQELRRANQHTQAEVAGAMGVGQDAISRLEQRGDMRVSTLRQYIESMGGTLELVARFPGQPPVVIAAAQPAVQPAA